MTKQKHIFIIFAFLINSSIAISQSVIASGVSSTKNTEASVFWAIGEFVSETIKNDENILTQGFYQIVFLPTSSEEIRNSNVQLVAFPNPVKSILTLKCADPQNMIYQLANINGAILFQNNIINNETRIPFNGLPHGLYLLTIKDGDQVVKNFKIEKH